ncbi:MAG TPA: pantoate--beta-alanine ligase, partial [Nitrospiria bacterium]|nr:pantoate--beta-alanine ligase [Nitrospiria bacterium]
YLSPLEKKSALVLYSALKKGRDKIREGEKSGTAIRTAMVRTVRKEARVRLDYAAVADVESLEPVKRIRGKTVLLIAGKVGKTRLIDNLLVPA